MGDSKDLFVVGSKVTVAQDIDLRGHVTIGSGTILHPKCTIVAMGGPITIGMNCIVEENVVIVNRNKETMLIGDCNLFQVGCRVESPSIGSHNTFGPKSRVSHSVSVSSFCNIGAGCNVLASPFSATTSDDVAERDGKDLDLAIPDPSISSTSQPLSPSPASEVLPEYTVVYGSENRRRIWSGEGVGQSKALHVKHLDYLREMLPKYNKLKMFV